MSYQYGAPVPAQQAGAGYAQQPPCWANERFYNSQTRECRACSFQNSCRDTIVRGRNAQAQAQPAPYYVQFPVAGYAPAPTHVPVAAPAVQVTPAPIPAQAAQAQPQQQVVRQVPPPQVGAFPAPQPYQYGWLHDPLYFALYSAPPPMVPQLEGEGFIERMGKNMARSMLTGVTAELFLAARQFVWAPQKPQEDPSNDGGRGEG